MEIQLFRPTRSITRFDEKHWAENPADRRVIRKRVSGVKRDRGDGIDERIDITGGRGILIARHRV